MVGSLKQSIKYPQNALMKSYSRLRWTSAFVSSSPKYTVHGEVWVVYNTSKSKDRNKGKASAKKQGERGGTPRDIRQDKYLGMNVHGPMDYAKTAISSRGPGPARKKKEVYQ